MCLVAEDSSQRLQLQGYWIKHHNTDVATETEESVVHPNGRFQQSEMRKQVEFEDFSTLTYTQGSDDTVQLKKLKVKDGHNCLVAKNNSVTHEFIRNTK